MTIIRSLWISIILDIHTCIMIGKLKNDRFTELHLCLRIILIFIVTKNLMCELFPIHKYVLTCYDMLLAEELEFDVDYGKIVNCWRNNECRNGNLAGEGRESC